ncbi:MAG: TolC family protein [Pseudobdellovibrionaceae bacterium]
MMNVTFLTSLRSLLCFGSAAACLLLSAQSVSAESLKESVADALSYNPEIDGAYFDREAEEATLREKRSDYYPRLNANTSAGRVYGDNATSRGTLTTRGAAYSNMWDASFTATETLFNMFRTGHLVDAAKSRVEAAKLSRADVEETVALQTVVAYLDILRADSVLEKAKAHAARIKDTKSKVALMVDNGAADESELHLVEQVEVDLRKLVTELEGQVRDARIRYVQHTGRPPYGELTVPENDFSARIPADMEAAVVKAGSAHPQVRATDGLVEAGKSEVEAERATYYPTVEGEISAYKRDWEEELGGEVIDNRAVVRLNWDFETGGATAARVARERAEVNRAITDKETARRRVEALVRQAYNEKDTSSRLMKIASEKYDANNGLLGTYRKQFEGGVIRLPQLLRTENDVFLAEIDKITLGYRMMSADYAILSAMGELRQSLGVAAKITGTEEETASYKDKNE